MPWRESSPMSERLTFIKACLQRSEHIVEICDRFGISEKTGHKWLRRFQRGGVEALGDQSHARHEQPHRMAQEIAAQIVKLRRKTGYGAAKLRDVLTQQCPHVRWPSASCIGELLQREQLIRPRRRRSHAAERAALDRRRTPAVAPNDVWTADFKGEFRLTNGIYCFPLTVLDLHSHYLLGCSALQTTAVAPTRRAFQRLFREFGLPRVVRSDNGVPFAQHNAVGRLGALAFWWVRLGIRPEHITPARPAENGAHERFHRTLKAKTIRPPASSLGTQQRRFDRFRQEYNDTRPHESVSGHLPPGKVYTAASRPYPERLPTICYPAAAEVRLVDRGGWIKWCAQPLFLSTNLAGQYVSLTENESELVTIAYASLALGDFDPHLQRFVPRVRWLD